jgi:hypothetical protein
MLGRAPAPLEVLGASAGLLGAAASPRGIANRAVLSQVGGALSHSLVARSVVRRERGTSLHGDC